MFSIQELFFVLWMFPLPLKDSILCWVSWMQCHFSEVFFCPLPCLSPPNSSVRVIVFSLWCSMERKSFVCHWDGGGPACLWGLGGRGPKSPSPGFHWVWALWAVIHWDLGGEENRKKFISLFQKSPASQYYILILTTR